MVGFKQYDWGPHVNFYEPEEDPWMSGLPSGLTSAINNAINSDDQYSGGNNSLTTTTALGPQPDPSSYSYMTSNATDDDYSWPWPVSGPDELASYGWPTSNTDMGDLNWPDFNQEPDHPAFGGGDEGQGGSYWGGGGGGGGGGGTTQSTGYQPSDVQWTIGDYNIGNFDNAPDWWQPMIPTNQTELNNPQVAYTMMQNALIGSGTLSEEDARAAAKSLSNMWGMQEANNPWGLYTTTPDSANLGEFAGINPMSAAFQAPQSEEQAAMGFTAPETLDSARMQSQGRAQDMLGAINNMTQATIGDEQYKYGPGLDYLQSIAGSLGEQGNQGRMTRQEALEMRGVMDPMLAQSQSGELGPYSEIARMMSNPFFANQPPGLTQMPGGGTQFGERNRNLSF